jgi:hypothetical protein
MAEAAAPLLTEYGCKPAVTAEAVGLSSEAFMNGSNRAPIPEPGDDACEVLLAGGLPSKTDRIAVADRRAQSLWYQDGRAVHLVQIAYDSARPGRQGSHWLVDAVNW